MAKKHEPSISPRDRYFLSVIFVLFGLASCAVAVFGIVGAAAEVAGWFECRSWQPAMAIVVDIDSRQGGSKQSGGRYVSGTYRYSVDGKIHTGNRIGHNDDAWSAFSGWQDDRFDELVAARNENRQVTVWYDPANPARAVFDRDLRWGLLMTMLPLAVFFTATTFAAIWLLRNLWRAH